MSLKEQLTHCSQTEEFVLEGLAGLIWEIFRIFSRKIQWKELLLTSAE